MNTNISRGRLNAKKIAPPGLSLLALILLSLLPIFVTDYTIIKINSIISFVIIAVSWSIFSGPTGYISLSTAAFYGLGMYASAILGNHLPLPLVMVISGIASFIIALIIGVITLRLRGVYFTIFTFGLVELLRNLILWLEIKFSGTRGRFVPSVDFQQVFYCILGTLAIILLISYLIKRSRFGLALIGIGESEDAAAHIGINTTLVKVLGFSISSFAVGAVGAAMATRTNYIDPGIAFNMLMSFMPVLMAIFGGMSTIPGPIIGAAVFAYLEELLITKVPEYFMIIFGAIMIIAILFLPNGLTGIAGKLFKRRKGAGKNANT
ncbi:MAG: branched-chain amino acid ABC transporter permease [Clostridiales bacterium]|jgi:branched-chain amino acid transport system permease protein|nr:branched-chain amino acid ABC transporter permease [Clostridiales bacterium]